MRKYLLLFVLLAVLFDIAAMDRAGAARKRAIDFDVPSYFPSEWEAAQARYDAGEFNEAADSFEELYGKAVPLYALAREDEIMAVRTELIASGLTYYYPEYLNAADDVALEALNYYEDKDYYTAKDTAAESLEMYETMLSGAAAYLVRREIIEREFMDVDADDFNRAEEAAAAALDAYEAGDIKSARSSADEAHLRYNLVLNTGWAAAVGERGEAAETERQRALDARADIAARNQYNAVHSIFEQASAALNEERFADAGRLFELSESQFRSLALLAEEKRALAQAALREAVERVEASDETARKAEEIIEGGSL